MIDAEGRGSLFIFANIGIFADVCKYGNVYGYI